MRCCRNKGQERRKSHVRWLSKRDVSGPCLPFPFTFLSLLHTDAVRALRVPNETSNKQTEALPLAGVVGYETACYSWNTQLTRKFTAKIHLQ